MRSCTPAAKLPTTLEATAARAGRTWSAKYAKVTATSEYPSCSDDRPRPM